MIDPPSRRLVLGVFLAMALVYLGFSWMRPLASPDEPRYAEIPREMVTTGNWITPRINGVLYFYKPPLFYWLEASAVAVGGLNPFFLRLWPALFALMGCFAVFAAGTRIYNRRTGLNAAIVLGSSLLYFGISQLILIDMVFSVLLSAALLCFLTAQREPKGAVRRRLFWGFYALVALSVLTKGILALLLPGAVIFLWLLLLGRWKELPRYGLLTGIPLFLAIAFPWHLAVAARHPEWFDFYIIREHFQRYLSHVSSRGQPFWFFLVVLPVGLIPWIGFLPQAIRRLFAGGWAERKNHAEAWFLLLWAVFLLAFFTTSKSKLIPYILPALPPLALLIGRFLTLEMPRFPKGVFVGNAIFMLLAAIGIPIGAWLQLRRGEIHGHPWLWTTAGSLVFAAVGIFWLLRARRAKGAILWPLAVGTACIAMIANPLIALFQPPSPVALLKSLPLTETDQIFSYQEYLPDLPLYTGRLVGAIDAIPDEQSPGLGWEDHSDRYMKMKRFRELWSQSTDRIFVVMEKQRLERFQEKIGMTATLVASDSAFAVFSNQPVSAISSP